MTASKPTRASTGARQRPGRLRRLRTFVWRLVLITPLALLVAVAALEVAIRSSSLPDNLLDDLNGTPIFCDRDGKVIAQLASDDARVHIPIPLAGMGEHLPAITIALEDHRFRGHDGVDLYAVFAAAYRSGTNPGHLSGASTITQQTIKLADQREGRRLRSKIRETVLALKLERQWDKDEILEAYINRLDYGNRRLGPEAAAWSYFGKPAETLTLAESVYLAGIPQSPTRHNPWLRPDVALGKYRRSLDRLVVLGHLTSGQAARLAAAPPEVRKDLPPSTAPFFVDALLRSAPDPPSPGNHPTTLDSALQREAESILASQLAALRRHDIRNAAMVVIENATGAVRALAGASTSGGRSEGSFNPATLPRHAGSTLKPFIYLEALERRALTAATLLPDTPDATSKLFPGYEPQNYNRGFAGPVRVRAALARSLNVPAVIVLHHAGPRDAFQALTEWGMHTDSRLEQLGAGFVLGNRKVTLLDLASAYAGLARGGVSMPPAFFSEHAPASQRRLASTGATALIADILADDEARAPSFGRRSVLFIPGHRTAVKTGTSSSHRDAWTVGFDRDHTTAVWFGNIDGGTMGDALTVETAAPAWHRMSLHLAQHRNSRPLPKPDLPTASIDALTGTVPDEHTGSVRTEHFLPGTAPATASLYNTDGRLQLPSRYSAWIASEHNDLAACLRPGTSPTIITPKDGSTYQIDPDLPISQQQLALRCDTPGTTWHSNGAPLAAPYLPLTPGTHKITAITPLGEATTTISVRR